jgi:hypothetical protein
MTTPKLIPCLGVGCGLHRTCAAYAAIENSDPREVRISHCAVDIDTGARVRYVPIVQTPWPFPVPELGQEAR